jgi:hypothetical protein
MKANHQAQSECANPANYRAGDVEALTVHLSGFHLGIRTRARKLAILAGQPFLAFYLRHLLQE